MRWYIKKNEETTDYILIGYSYEQNETCDGILRYDKKTEEITVVKYSDGASEISTKLLFSLLYGVISGEKNMGYVKPFTEEVTPIVIG
jgi:hypothetical protein